MTRHKVENTWIDNMHIRSKVPGGRIDFDSSENFGGQDKGVRAKPAMLASLASCTAIDVISLFKKMRAIPEDFKVNVEGELTDEHPKIYHKVKIEYFFIGKDLKRDKLEKCVKLSVERYCGVIEMFRSFADIEVKIHFKEI